MQHSSTKTKGLAALAVMGLAIATSALPRAARAQSASATIDNIDDGDVSDWKPFAGNGATLSHRTSSSRATSGTLSMKLTYSVSQGGYAGVEKSFPAQQNWSAASAFTMSVNGLGTGHQFRVQIYEAGGERWEHSFTVGFNGWQQVTIPFGSFTRAGYQVPGAQVNSVFDRGAIKGIALIPSNGPGSNAVYVDSLAVNGATSPSTPAAPSAPAPAPTTPAGTIIPLYSYPSPGAWDSVIAAKRAYPKVPVMAVVNPSSGPGTAASSAYMNGIAQLINAGIKVVGYVPTTYGQRAPADVQADIKRWKSLYPSVTGIFLDEMQNKTGHESYYKSITSFAKSNGFDYVMGNPGADSVPSYVGTVDMMFIYERDGFPATERMAGWHASYDKRNFGIIPYAVPYMSRSFIANARQYVGYIYLQNDTMPNPWDTVPPFLMDMMAALAS
jgi:hypothetical protein